MKVRWGSPEASLEWAAHQAWNSHATETVEAIVARFNKRLSLPEYLKHRVNATTQELLNLSPAYPAAEDPQSTIFLNKLTQQLDRMLISYPEKVSPNNRYYSLGPGDRLFNQDSSWIVNLSEPDFTGKKPPKIHMRESI